MQYFSAYRNILSRSNWQTDETHLPTVVADWLFHSDSLTEKLQQICPSLSVEVINQGWQAVGFDENFAKKTKKQTACWLREVILKCGEQHWIFAQTRLPKITIDNVAQDVLTLGNQPIGLWLFPQNPKRQTLEWQQDLHSGLYARRSLLHLQQYPIEICELFLPQFPFER
ncbi:chorismate lyase [Glaesserella sp.]|uniref:chorismate--pyruvate lyase family protein n=1 Tax=Glaesserella sp. TaxID=2094731 RepID=UPI00359F2F3F